MEEKTLNKTELDTKANNVNASTDFEKIAKDIDKKLESFKKMDIIKKHIKDLRVLEFKVQALKAKITRLNQEL